MPFRLIEVTSDAQFEKMMPSYWESMNNPRMVMKELLFPVKGDGPDAEAEAIEDCKNRMLAAWHENLGGRYVQVLDEDNGDTVIACAFWNFYIHNNPFANPSEVKTTELAKWWPMGSEIWKYTVLRMEQGKIPRLKRQNKPHIFLGGLHTASNYRRRGAGTMLMDWGVKKADELGLECFLDSTPMAVKVYESFGFLVVDQTIFDTTVKNPSEGWKELEERYPLIPLINMWRPVGGKYTREQKYPWEECISK